MIDLEDKYLKILRKILGKYAFEYKAVTFGSRVQGTAKKFSDIDIALIGTDKIGWRELEKIKDAFSESDMPLIVDIIDYNSVSDSFKIHINSNYDVIKDKEQH